MTNEAVISLIKMRPGISKMELCRELDKRGDTRSRAAQYAQFRELQRYSIHDRNPNPKQTSLFVNDE